MPTVHLTGNLKTLLESVSYDVRTVKISMVVAMNKCAAQIKSEGARQLSKAVKIPVRATRSRVKVTKAYAKRREYASVTTLNQPFPIDRLGPRELKRGGYLVAGRKFPHAFRAFSKSGSAAQQRIIFQRKGKSRLPIERVGIPLLEEAERIFPVIFRKYTENKLPRLFEHELKRRLGGRAR